MMEGPKRGPDFTLAVFELIDRPGALTECSLPDGVISELARRLDEILVSPTLLNSHLATVMMRINARSASGPDVPEHCFMAPTNEQVDELEEMPLASRPAAWLRARRIDILACNPATLLELHIDLRASMPHAWLPVMERLLSEDTAQAPDGRNL